MGQNLKVKFWADMPSNPDNLPGNVIAEVQHVALGETVMSPWLKLTREEFMGWGVNVAAKRKELEAYIRQRAYELETEGMDFNGGRIATGRDDQAMLSGAVNYLNLNPNATIDWQAADGSFVTLNKAAVEAIASAVGAHVQAHFTRRKELFAELAEVEDAHLDAFRATITDFWED